MSAVWHHNDTRKWRLQRRNPLYGDNLNGVEQAGDRASRRGCLGANR